MKFRYGDNIKVIKGFFEGLHGFTVEYDGRRETYLCELYGVRNNQHTDTIQTIKEELIC